VERENPQTLTLRVTDGRHGEKRGRCSALGGPGHIARLKSESRMRRFGVDSIVAAHLSEASEDARA
jgi:hypothetical protein